VEDAVEDAVEDVCIEQVFEFFSLSLLIYFLLFYSVGVEDNKRQ
jgi:hypothetical protein